MPLRTVVVEAFGADPIANHSARFPLSRTNPPAPTTAPSPAEVRPWGLAGMRVARCQGDPLRDTFRYDHHQQIALDRRGRHLTAGDPTADKVSSNDGDEGPSEDYNNDFCPDTPLQV